MGFSPVCYSPVVSCFNMDECHVETKQSKGQKTNYKILSLLSPLSCYFHLFSLSLSLCSFSSFSEQTKPEHHKHQNKRDKGCELCATQRKKKKKSNFLFDNFSYRAKSAPRSEVSGWRKSVIEQTKKELKISILSREAKKILPCKVGWDYHPYPYTQPSIGRNQIWQLLPRMIKSQAQHSHPLFFLFWCLW